MQNYNFVYFLPQDCVGPDNVSGYGKDHDLAAYLVGLRDQQRPIDSINRVPL